MVNVSTLNPRNWVTPMAVYNSSCERSVRVEFELVTQNDDGVDGYEVSIFKIFLDEEGYLDYARVYQRDYILVIMFFPHMKHENQHTICKR